MAEQKKIYGFLATIKLLRIAGYDCELGDAARRVLMILVGYVDQEGVCFPSVSKIAKQYGLSRQAIRKQIITLEESGYLEVTASYYPNGGRRSNIYALNLQIAEEYGECPEIFGHPAKQTILAYLVTLLRYGDTTLFGDGVDNFQGVHEHVTSKGDIKKKEKDNIRKKNIKKYAELKKYDWEYDIEYAEKHGVDRNDIADYKEARLGLIKIMSPPIANNYIMYAEKLVKGLKPAEAIKERRKYLQEVLKKKLEENCDACT